MLITIITFIVILGILVFFHEIGHFIVARKSGVKIEEFGFGLPPRLFGIYKDPMNNKWKVVGTKIAMAPTTIYSINMVPLGGFVKIKGEQGENSQDNDSFGNKSIWRRIAILSAGVSMNVILAIFLLSVGYWIGIPKDIDSASNFHWAKISNVNIYISEVMKDFPAYNKAIKPMDIIIAIDNKPFTDIVDIQNYVNNKKDSEIVLTIKRNEKEFDVKLIPKYYEDTKKVIMGIMLVKRGVISYPWYIAIIEGFKTTINLTKEILLAFTNLFKNIIVKQTISVDLSGPVGIAIITSEVAKLGFIYLLQFTAILSLNLAIINFFPLPALDGGRVMFLLIEKIRGKSINSHVESVIHNIGLYLLFLLVIVITYRDIIRFSDKFTLLWHRITQIF